VRRLKIAYWILLDELRTFRMALLNALPGRGGQRARARFYRPRLKACGTDFVTEQHVQIQGVEQVRVGDRVYVARDCYLSAAGGLDIGSDSYLGPGTKIWTNNHHYDDPHTPFVDQGWEFKPVCIEQDVWIGPRCFVKPGTTIKVGAVVKPGTVVARSVPPFAIVQGNPGRIVGWRRDPAAGPRRSSDPTMVRQ
jgi:acetyltransferase-like isoleucine patch superfamily enzyme